MPAVFCTVVPFGALVRLTASFRDDAGDPVDPTTVTAKTKDPNGVVLTYGYLTSPADIVRDELGEYHVDVVADEVGTWTYKWIGTGAGQAVAAAEFKVDALGSDF